MVLANKALICYNGDVKTITNRTHKVFYVFDFDETEEIYKKWVYRKH
jgi:hypothetical protein